MRAGRRQSRSIELRGANLWHSREGGGTGAYALPLLLFIASRHHNVSEARASEKTHGSPARTKKQPALPFLCSRERARTKLRPKRATKEKCGLLMAGALGACPYNTRRRMPARLAVPLAKKGVPSLRVPAVTNGLARRSTRYDKKTSAAARY